MFVIERFLEAVHGRERHVGCDEPFDPRRASLAARSGTLDRPRTGGLGLRFVNALMDEVDYVRSGQYNQVKLKKMLQPPGAAVKTGEATGK